MKKFVRYVAAEDVEYNVNVGNAEFQTSIKDATSTLINHANNSAELYEVTFKLIKTGIVSVTTNVKLIKE